MRQSHVTRSPVRVLLIEDNPADARLIREMLVDGSSAFDLDWARDLPEGLERLARIPPDVALVDLSLPASVGLATFRAVFEHAPQIPIVVLTGLDDETLAVRSVQSGAQDYLVKGDVDSALLVRSVRYAIERKRTEERLRALVDELRRNQKLLAEAQQIAHVGSWEWDVVTNELTWTDELYRIYGIDPKRFGATFDAYLEHVHAEDRERVRGTIEQAIRDGRPFDFEERIVRSDGAVRDLHSRGDLVVDAGRVVRVIGACQDVTERKRFEAELAGARDAALQSTRLKSAFLANMSHEIRTPLNMILGYNVLMAEDFAGLDQESRAALFSGVQSAAKRLMATVDGVLDISKIETGNFDLRPTLLDLPALVAGQVVEFGHLAEAKGLTLACMIAEPRATILFDGYCLTHALMNLLQNAIKFTEEGGISVILDRAPDGRLRLSVRDSGIGIDPAFLPHLFEPFSQEDTGYTRRFEGSGLGLALTKQFLELNAATVSVESEKGNGSVFRILFPFACEA